MVITEASKLSNFSCSSSMVIGVSLACTARVSSLYSSPRPSSIFSVRSSASRGAPRRASSSIFALMDCKKAVTLSEPLVISLSWLLACLMRPREGLA